MGAQSTVDVSFPVSCIEHLRDEPLPE